MILQLSRIMCKSCLGTLLLKKTSRKILLQLLLVYYIPLLMSYNVEKNIT